MSGRLLSASPFLVATNSQFPRVEAWKKFRQNMNIINEQARANSKKTQHDASANVFTITLEKVYSYKSEEIIITTQTNYLKATAKRN